MFGKHQKKLEDIGVLFNRDDDGLVVDCRSSELQSCDLELVARLRNVHWLSLDGISLQRTDLVYLRQLPDLRYLSLCECGLRSIPDDTFNRLAKLKILRLQFLAEPSSLLNSMQHLPCLESLDLSNTTLSKSLLGQFLSHGSLTDLKCDSTVITRTDALSFDIGDAEPYRLVSVQLGDGRHATLSLQVNEPQKTL